MSDRLAAKIKENAGKPKYSSLNLNQTYKGNKVEIKTSTGATRHGLQSLGKIGSSRRIPPPANLPSLKSENSGNDPTVSLVPSGGGGWGSTKEKTESSTPQNSSPSTTPAPQISQGSVPTTQQPLLQPQRPIQPSSYPSSQPATQPQSQSSGPTRQDTTTTTQEKSEAHAKTWGTISQSEAGGQAKPYSHQPTPYFNREFPTLGGPDNGDTKPERKEFSHGQAPIIRNTHEPPWMERSGPGPPPHGYGRDHDMFNGGPGRGDYHRRPPPDFQHSRGHHYSNSQHSAQGGRPPPHGYPAQDQYGRPYQRPGPGQRPGMRIDKRYETDRDMDNKPVIRPAVLRPEDIQAMDDEDDDGGWAGAHGEVDYTAKLNFEDFDEEEKSKGDQEEGKSKHETDEKKVQKAEEPSATDTKKESDQGKESAHFKRPQDTDRPPQKPRSAWGEAPQVHPQYGENQYGREARSGPPQRPFDGHRPAQGQGYHGGSAPWNMQYPPHQRGQYSPVSGSPPADRGHPGGTSPKQDSMGPPMRREDEPLSEWAARKQEMHAAVERARMRREQEEQELQAKTKAAALMKLKALEEKRGRAPSETSEESKEGVAEISKTKSLESGKSERETRGEEVREKNDKDTELPSDQKTVHYPAPLHSDQKVPPYRADDSSRRRNDSDSSDASRSSGSRQYFQHQQRNIPPRFQQKRQQQQQQYQQQQLYQATHPMSQPQREALDLHPVHGTDSGPVSPSGAGKTSRPTETIAPKRIMKRTDSSSTAGDDVASVKSLDSTGEREKGSRQRANSGTTSSPSEQESRKTDARDKGRPGDSTVKSVDKELRKDALEEKENEKRDKTPIEPTGKGRSDQEPGTAPRKREYRSSDRKPEEVHKRKRDETEEDYEERRNKMTSRDRQTDGRGRLRPGSGYRGRGRGIARGRSDYRVGGSDNRQRGMRDTRQRRDSRDNRDYRKDERTERTREPRESLKSEDRNKDSSDKISSEDREVKGKIERAPQKKDERTQPNRESQERKPSYQEKPAKDSHEREKGERRNERPEKRMDRYERKDERERVQRKPPDQRRTDGNKENKAETKRAVFPARDVREEEHFTTQRSTRDGQDRRQERERYRDQDNNYYKDRPRDRDRDKDRERMKPRDQDRIREAPRSSRGHERNHRGVPHVRGRGAGSTRGGRIGSGRLVGSGRISQRTPKKEEPVSEEEDVDDSGSESSSYTTATSASEERIEDKEEKPKERPRTTSQSGSTSRTPVRSTRGSRARGGGFPRPRRENEKPPRFQKQQERAAAQRGSSSRGGYRSGDRGSRGRGRGRGRGMPSSRDMDDREGGSIQPTEDWEDEVNQSPKEQDKSGDSHKRAPKSGDQYSNRRTSSRDESGRQGGRRDGGPSSTRKTDSFLAEKQVKVEGSKLTTLESKGALPAAKSTDLAQGKKSSGTPKEEKRSDYSAVDTIESKTQKRTDSAAKKANIQLYDLHNVAGVICIDDIPDDASDISSSGFVEVTSKRTQKELKEKQREEDERRKRSEEKASQRSSEKSEKFKKSQANKPPRFSKQHQNSAASISQGKAMATKSPSALVLDGITGLVSSEINSNSSSTNSTKRNSPVTVERPPSPQPPPVFNAWNKPLSLVTPAKAPGSSLAIASNVPDPLAVGSGKPSRQTQPSTVVAVQNSLINSNIEDKSAEDELKEITKEIESMAPTEEQEEVQEKTEKKSEHSTASSGARERRHDGAKKSQPKPQKPPRFDKSSKRKSTTEDGAKKEYAKEESKKEKSRLIAKQSDVEPSDAASATKRTPVVEESSISDASSSDKKVSEVVIEDTPSEKKGIHITEKDEAIRESEKDSVPRKDSDYSVDSEEQASEDGSMFSNSRPLSVDITDSSEETQDRPPTPVSPIIIAEMKKRMNAAYMAWHQTPSTSVGLTSASMETTPSWPETSSPSVSIESKDGSTIVKSSADTTNEYRENTEDSVSKADVTKPTEVQFSGKKPGGNEQQNVCKVKPQQQQQPVKPQQTSTLAPAPGEDRGQSDLESMVPTQPVLPQEHLLRQNVHNTYPFPIEAQILQLQQRQPQQFIQPLQSMPQSAQVAANNYQLSQQMHQVRQPTSASSLAQSPQELFQSPFLTSNLYPAGGFSVSQPYISLTMVATTTTPSYVSTSTRTQATSVMALQGQQPKTMNSSMFGPSGSPAQTMYMPFDPQSMGGTATLLNFNQQSQQAQRQMMGNQALGFTDVMTQQPHVQHAPPAGAPQQIQSTFSFHTKPPSFDGQQGTSIKSMEPSHGEYNQSQSEMVKHINAKPFEPPKRISTPTPSSSTANSGMGLLTSAVNPNLVHIGPSPPNMGPLSHSPPMQTSYISNRQVSMSPVDPNVSFAAGTNSFAKHAPMSHFQLSQQQRQQTPVQQFTPFQSQPVHIKPQQLQQHQTMNIRPQGQPSQLPSQQQHNVPHMPGSGVPHQMIPRQYGHVGPSQPSVGNQRFPGPIQRPPTSVALQGMPPNISQHQPRPIQPPRPIRQQAPRMPPTQKVPIVSTRPQFPPQVPVSSQSNQFKAMQHQKMLAETRMFFATDPQSRQKSPASVNETSSSNELKGQNLQQQGQNPGQVFPQTYPKQQMPMQPMVSKHQNAPVQEGMKMSSQHRQALQHKQVPLAPTSGVHHQNKSPRMSQENKPKQTSQEKKEKKEENKSHIIELPRKKPQDNMNKPKPNKTDSSKSEDGKRANRMDGKPNTNKRSRPVRITPMIQKPPQGGAGPPRPTKPRPQAKNTSVGVPPNKPKTDGTATTTATTVATGVTTTATMPKPPNDAVVSSKGKDLEESSPKDPEEVKITVNPLTTMTS